MNYSAVQEVVVLFKEKGLREEQGENSEWVGIDGQDVGRETDPHQERSGR